MLTQKLLEGENDKIYKDKLKSIDVPWKGL